MKDAPVSVKVNIAGKQADLVGKVDKLTNIFRFVFASYNPQTGQFAALQNPTMLKLFRQILELSGLDASMFSYVQPAPAPASPVPVSSTRPLQALSRRPSIAEQVTT